MTETPVIYVDVYQTKRLLKREWRWRAINAGNRKTMATSGEGYLNRADCMAAVYQLFGAATNVYLRQHELGNVVLRMAVVE